MYYPLINSASPRHLAGITHPAMLLIVVAAAGFADIKLAVQTQMPAVKQKHEGLKAVDAVGCSEVGLSTQQLPLFNLLLNFGL